MRDARKRTNRRADRESTQAMVVEEMAEQWPRRRWIMVVADVEETAEVAVVGVDNATDLLVSPEARDVWESL